MTDDDFTQAAEDAADRATQIFIGNNDAAYGYSIGYTDGAEWARAYLTEQQQPTTITDEMVARARESLRAYGWTVGKDDTGIRAALAAALTEPTRPEGAEEIEAIIADQIGGDVAPAAIRDIANRIAAHLAAQEVSDAEAVAYLAAFVEDLPPGAGDDWTPDTIARVKRGLRAARRYEEK